MFKVAICDDDIEFLLKFEPLVKRGFDTFGVQVNTYTDGRVLIEAIEKGEQIFDVIFLDVEMPAINGFLVAQKLRELDKNFVLIFNTFLEGQARRGYQYDAFRYIFKNNLEQELKEAIEAITSKLSTKAEDDEIITLKYRCLGVLESLEVKRGEILYFRLEKTRRVTLKTIYSEYDLLTKPLSEYAEQLGGASFYLVMRNYLLNFNRVTDIDKDSFVMEDGETIPLGLTRETQKSSKQKYMQFVAARL